MELVDTFWIVPSKNDDDPDRRNPSLPIWDERYAWWTSAVRRQLKVFGIDQKELSHRLKISEGSVSRAIRRVKPIYDIVIAISDELKVAYPVILPESEEEALHMAEEKRLYKRDVEARKIKAGVAEIPDEDQAPPVVSEHAVRSRKDKTTTGSRRRQQPQQR